MWGDVYKRQKYYYVKDGKIVYTPIEFNIENGFLYDGEEFEGTKYYQYCTAIPVGTLLAQTWDTGLVQMVGHMIGEEMEHFGVSLWLAPCLLYTSCIGYDKVDKLSD